jgi:hypothetical protein
MIALRFAALGGSDTARRSISIGDAEILVPIPSFYCIFVIDRPISFHHMQSLGVRGVSSISTMVKGPVLIPTMSMTSVSPLVVADGIPIPGRCYQRGMRLVHAHLAEFIMTHKAL